MEAAMNDEITPRLLWRHFDCIGRRINDALKALEQLAQDFDEIDYLDRDDEDTIKVLGQVDELLHYASIDLREACERHDRFARAVRGETELEDIDQ
jgi:hypothetical protein